MHEKTLIFSCTKIHKGTVMLQYSSLRLCIVTHGSITLSINEVYKLMVMGEQSRCARSKNHHHKRSLIYKRNNRAPKYSQPYHATSAGKF